MSIHTSDSALIQSYIDGELSGSDLEEFERNLGESEELRALVSEREKEHDTLRALLAAPPAPDLLASRIRRGLDGIDAERASQKRRQLMGWILPGSATLAAAAALAVFVGVSGGQTEAPEATPYVARDAVEQRFRPQPVALVAAQELQPTNAIDQGVAVQAPLTRMHLQVSRALSEYFQQRVIAPRFSDPAVQLSGWRPSQIRGRAAAELQYSVHRSVGNYQVVVHILTANDLDLRGRTAYRAGNSQVWLDKAYGYNAVLYKDPFGVGYVISSEMPGKELVNLVVGSDLFGENAGQ